MKAYNNLGVVLVDAKEINKAFIAFKNAVKCQPGIYELCVKNIIVIFK